MKEPRKKTLILGLGNPLSGDDGFGARVLERLRQNEPEAPHGVHMADAHTDLLNHLEDFARYDCIVLIDAILDPEGKQGEPGRVAAIDETVFQSWPEASQSVHQVSPLLAVKLFRQLHPDAGSRIVLVGLFVDRVGRTPLYATDERIVQAAGIVLALAR